MATRLTDSEADGLTAAAARMSKCCSASGTALGGAWGSQAPTKWSIPGYSKVLAIGNSLSPTIL